VVSTTIFGPARSWCKIHIIDETYMAMPADFNALLKVVEESRRSI
jgi:DNA polymerase III gamma/tau subunit